MEIVSRDQVASFITKDGSEIRELLAYRNSAIRKQSLAEACVPAGTTTQFHKHQVTEEIYFILEGSGDVRLEDSWLPVKPGDSIPIPPGTPHQIRAHYDRGLKFLCCCVPAYEHADTVMLEDK